MIIEQLVLHDFGVYKGRHEIDLTPESSDKPIILIGALNGHGKTTILDAINLVLFGPRGNISNRKPNMAWDTYLKDSINRGASGGALVGMRFTIEDDFEVHIYEIARSWQVTGKSVREYFDVSVNGQPDRLLAEDWDDHIEGLLPLEIASLNFFDGEKINRIADPVRSKNVVEAAIRGLLGLGVLERLEADLKVLLRRKQEEAIGDNLSPEFLAMQSEIEALEERRSSMNLELAQVRTQLERNREKLKRAEDQARSLGADKWEQRADFENQRTELNNDRLLLEADLFSLVEGSAPLRLVTDLLHRTEEQMNHDAEVYKNQLLLRELEERDTKILEQLEKAVADVVKPVLETERNSRRKLVEQKTVHGQSNSSKVLVSAVLREVNEKSNVSNVLERLDELDSKINSIERALMSVPTEDQLAPILEELGRVRALDENLSSVFEELSQELSHIRTTIDRLQVQIDRERAAEAEKQKVAMEELRSRQYAQRALETVVQLSKSTINRNLEVIEKAIYERFGELIGKKSLVTEVRIDRESMELTVISGDNEILPIERLSSGERQLLATATLWGLSSVAGRSIPLVIDTPLGRLDEGHRMNLATNYFPVAAPQVVILSTDSEFDPELYATIKKAIGREYLIQFDEAKGSSQIREGYFVEVLNAN